MRGHACLHEPDLALAAALRAEPELRGRPLAIVDPAGSGSPAIIAGWLRGLTVAQARTVEPGLVIRALGAEGVRVTREVLIDVALSAGPRVMEERPGAVFLELAGLEALFPTPRGLLTALGARLDGAGLPAVRLGIGPTRTVAALAARAGDGGHVVGDDARAFLAPLPLDLLDPPDDLADRLWRWGVRTLGELADLPRDALGARLGKTGADLARRARGEDLTPFRPVAPRLEFDESIDLEHAVENLESLAFVLRGLLDRLTQRLRLRGLAVRRIWAELGSPGGERHARDVELAAPTLEVPVLTSLLRLALEASPPRDAVERVRVVATPGGLETAQLDLFLPPLPAPAELAMTVARIESIAGTGRVAAPEVRDTHLPDAPGTRAFRFTDAQHTRATSRGEPVLPPRACMAQRALRPPRAARVHARARPEHVGAFDGARGGRVLQCAGPWRFFGEWWGDAPFARDYWDVELDDGGVYRIYHTLEDDSWYVDGIYD